MFAKKFLTGSIVSLSLILGSHNVVCADKITVEVKNYYGKRILELREDNHIIFNQGIPNHYLYTYHVDQLNNMEVEDEESINIIHQATERATMANSAYYESMEPGADLSGIGTIYAEHGNSLKSLLTCLNSAKK